MTTSALAQQLFGHATHLLAKVATPESTRLMADLPALPVGTDTPPVDRPVSRFRTGLPALAAPATRPLVDAFAQADATDMSWYQSYTAADFGAAFIDNYGWVEILGPFAPFACESHRLGILLFGPDTHYPSHAHEPEEIYIVLAGEILWTHADQPEISCAPGTVIHHATMVPHALTTQSTPVALLALWRGGNLARKSDIL
ncbi:MAG: dimethylsulfonioproprionate lyase family protein [Pseudomonadota bacterium]